jgi:tRNA (guanine-N7-)-methyltransferase
VGKNKIQRFDELSRLERVFQPDFDDIFRKDHLLKGQWKSKVFNNENPLILELGCGKGEYTIGMARVFPEKNFIGVDIKGARLWKGAKESNMNNLLNAAFLRTRIEFINSFFDEDEVDEIWITFPDPQAKPGRMKKRLTSPLFLSSYQKFLKDNGLVHLKTDSDLLYDYTLLNAERNFLAIKVKTNDLYQSDFLDTILGINTFYEKQFLNTGKSINYLCFALPKNLTLMEYTEDETGR